MKKLLPIIIINVLLCTQALAEWSFVTTLQDGKGTKVYIDPETLTKDSNYSYIWKLDDLKVPYQGTKSAAMHLQIDCNSMRAKILQYVFYTDQMGRGKPTSFVKDRIEWKAYPPGANMHNIIKGVCSY